MRKSLVAGGAAVALAVLTACSSNGTTSAADNPSGKDGYVAVADTSLQGSGDLTVQLDYDSVETDGLDPATAATARSWSIMSLTYETLVTIGSDFSVQPMLAKSWTHPDPKTYVFNLRSGVKFSNGRVMTPADVVGSLKRLIASKSAYSTQLGPVSSITATGADQVTIKLSAPYTAFLPALANTPAAILPMKEIDAHKIDVTKTMVGTGPFVPTSHRQDVSWTFAPNSNYRNASDVHIKKLTLQIVSDESARLAAIRSGSAGFDFFNNIDSLNLLSSASNTKAVSQRNSDFYYLMVNAKSGNPILADQKVRFALNTALDRQQIADVAFAGKVVPTGVTPAVLPGACKVADLPSEKASEDSAEQTLKDAGATGKTLRLLIYNSEPANAQIAQLIEQQLAKVGVKVKIQNLDDATWNDKVFGAKPDFDLAISWFAGYVDPTMVTRWWNPEVSLFDKAFLNDDPTVDQLITKAATQPDGTERNTTMQQLCDQVDQDSGMLPLVTRPAVIGYRTDKVSPTLYANEGYGNILRSIVDFRIPNEQ